MENQKHDIRTFIKMKGSDWPTTVQTLTLSRNEDGSVRIGTYNDISHGDRQFTLSKKDVKIFFEELKNLIGP